MAETSTITDPKIRFDREDLDERARQAEHEIDYETEAIRFAAHGGQALTAEYAVLLEYDPRAAFIDAVQGGIGPMGG